MLIADRLGDHESILLELHADILKLARHEQQQQHNVDTNEQEVLQGHSSRRICSRRCILAPSTTRVRHIQDGSGGGRKRNGRAVGGEDQSRELLPPRAGEPAQFKDHERGCPE